MANQQARQDKNQKIALIAHSEVSGSAETRQVIATDGNLHTVNLGGVAPISSFDNIVTTYPDGTTEVYTYKLGTTTIVTTTAVYLDTTKGSISTVVRS